MTRIPSPVLALFTNEAVQHVLDTYFTPKIMITILIMALIVVVVVLIGYRK